VLSGVWHGAGWTFILWGLLHGLGLIVENYFLPQVRKEFHIINWLRTQLWVMVCWIFFRSQTFQDAVQLFISLFQWHKPPLLIDFSITEIMYGLIIVILIPLSEYFRWQHKLFLKNSWLFFALLLVATYLLGNFKSSSFLYFQF